MGIFEMGSEYMRSRQMAAGPGEVEIVAAPAAHDIQHLTGEKEPFRFA